MPDIVLPVAVLLLCVITFCTAWACYALRNFSRSRLEEICNEQQKPERFGVILRGHEESLLAAELLLALVSLTLVFCTVSWLGLWSPDLNGTWGWLGYLLELCALFGFLIGLTIVLPWILGRVAGEVYLYRLWPIVSAIRTMARPFLAVIHRIDTITHRLGGLQEPGSDDKEAITEELRSVLSEGQREGVLESEAHNMIQKVIELQEDDVGSIMTPRTEMVCIPVESSLEEARIQLLDAGHSRVPVIKDSPDEMVGLLYAKDLLQHIASAPEEGADLPGLASIVREPYYVPETAGIDQVLESMKRKQMHVAIVLDEYGGVSGLVTMEDILEEIVGEIVDEYDAKEEDPIRELSPGVTEVDARTNVDDVNERLAVDLPEGDYDTIAGFVFSQFGRIPRIGESCTWGQYRITVLKANQKKLETLRIERDPLLAEAAADSKTESA